MSLNNIVRKQFQRTQFLMEHVRLQPFETATPEGRSQERYRRASLTTLTSVISQGIKVLTVLFTVPLTLEYLGDERYGVWLVMSSIIAFIAFADLGISNGLLNIIAEAHGQNDRELAKKAVSTAFIALFFIALLLGLLFAVSYSFVPWSRMFNVTSSLAQREVGPAVIIFSICFLINIPLGIVQRIQLGYQEGYHNNIWKAVASILGLIGVLLCIHMGWGLPAMVLVFAGIPVLVTFLNGLYLWGKRHPHLRPNISEFSLPISRKIINLGLMFFILQLAVALAFTADNLVIAQILGVDAVTQYGVPQRLFGLVTLLVGLVLTPLWPAYGEAMARHDSNWVKKTLTRTIKLSLMVVVPLAIFLVLSGKFLINAWVGSAVQPTFILLLGFGIWTVLSTLGNSFAMFLNGAGIVRFQAVSAIIMATSNLLLSIFLTQNIGLSGPIWGTVISYTLFTMIPIAIYIKKLLNKNMFSS